MLGSLTFYRRLLKETIFSNSAVTQIGSLPMRNTAAADTRLPSVGHGIAGILAGVTVSLIAAPVEHISKYFWNHACGYTRYKRTPTHIFV